MKEILFKNIGNYELIPMSCYIKRFSPSFYMGMHNHIYYEMMYASKGNFLLEIMKRSHKEEESGEIFTVTVHQGELIFLDSNLFHRLVVNEEEVTIYNAELQPCPPNKDHSYSVDGVVSINFAALFEKTSLKTLAENKEGYVIVPNLSNIDSAFRDLIYSIMKPCSSLEEACYTRSNILLFFLEIAKSLTLFEQNSVHYIKKIQLYIKHHLNQKISLDDIAREVGYHKSYIASQFKIHTGKTIIQTVNELRISKSLRLLRDTSLSVSEIAKQVGFPSYGQMVYEFKKTIKMSPSACRKVFLNDEIDYNSPQWSSIAIRINEEDFLLDDEAFNHAYYRKHLNTRSKEFPSY